FPLAAFMLLLLAPAPAPAQSCAGLGPIGVLLEQVVTANDLDPALGEAFCADYGLMAERLLDLEGENEALRDELAAIGPSLPPAGTILLVDRGQGCPPGWTDLGMSEPEVFAGRLPVAVGFVEGREFRAYRQVGGSESHRLREAELPPHDHGLPLGFTRLPVEGAGASNLTRRSLSGPEVAVAGRTGRARSERTGTGEAFSLMPPFVGVFFCRRD
ncbi:MAG: hypothetical protein ACOC3D_13580, partial [Pseudomonadota bacterium]